MILEREREEIIFFDKSERRVRFVFWISEEIEKREDAMFGVGGKILIRIGGVVSDVF